MIVTFTNFHQEVNILQSKGSSPFRRSKLSGYRITVNISVFQTDDAGSIPAIRSKDRVAKLVNVRDCKSLRYEFESLLCLQII